MMKYKFLLFALIPVLFGGCIFFTINNDFEYHTAHFKNDSSRDIYIQHYLRDHNDVKSGIYFAYGTTLAKHTIDNTAGPLDDPYLEKILIVDTGTRKLLRKISGEMYYSMLTSPEVTVEKNSNGGKTTHYSRYFEITDAFLNGN